MHEFLSRAVGRPAVVSEMASRPTRQHLKPHDVIRCTSMKYGFSTRNQALDGAERMMELGKVDPGCHLMPYLCKECAQWHIYNKQIVPLSSDTVRNRRVDA